MTPPLPRALFLDRDGTLIIDKVYLSDPAGVELYPQVGYYLRRLRELGVELFLFTNQSGIGRGYYTLADAEAVNARLVELLGLQPPAFDGVCIAPEAPSQPMVYRKPSPRFLLETLQARGYAASECLMVGDSEADVGAARAAGMPVVALRTGKIDPLAVESVCLARVPVFEDFAAFARDLLGE